MLNMQLVKPVKKIESCSAPSVIGSMLLWLWVDGVLFSPVFFRPVGITAEFLLCSFICTVFVCSAVLLAGALRPAFVNKILGWPSGVAAVSLTSIVSGLLVLFAAWKSALPLLILGSVGNGLVFGFGVLAWGRVYVSYGAKGMSVHGPLVFALAAGVALAFNIAPESIVVSGVMLLAPSVSFAILLSIVPTLPERKETLQASKDVAKGVFASKKAFSLSWNVAVAFLVFGMACGFMQHQVAFGGGVASVQDGSLLLAARMAVSAILFLGSAFLAWKTHMVYRVGLVVMVAGFMVLPFSFFLTEASSFVPGIIVMGGYACFDVMCWAVLAEIAYCSTRPYQETVGFGRMLVHLGVAAGMAMGALLSTVNLSVTLEAMISTSVGYLVVIAVVLLIGDGHGLWSLMKYGSAYSTQETSVASDGLSHKLALFCLEYGLTSREREVLELFSVGRSTKFIAEQLFVSENTVKSHVRHIYAKAGIHGKQELMDAVSSFGDDL